MYAARFSFLQDVLSTPDENNSFSSSMRMPPSLLDLAESFDVAELSGTYVLLGFCSP